MWMMYVLNLINFLISLFFIPFFMYYNCVFIKNTILFWHAYRLLFMMSDRMIIIMKNSIFNYLHGILNNFLYIIVQIFLFLLPIFYYFMSLRKSFLGILVFFKLLNVFIVSWKSLKVGLVVFISLFFTIYS